MEPDIKKVDSSGKPSFEDLCSCILNVGQKELMSNDIPDALDNLFYEFFGLSSNDAAYIIRHGEEKV